MIYLSPVTPTESLIEVVSILTPQPVDTDELHTEAIIVLRTVEHITFDLDRFSQSIRHGNPSSTVVTDIERHLGQARRNCADATAIANTVMHEVNLNNASPDSVASNSVASNLADRLRDAFAMLALADSAYLRAFEVAGVR